MTGRTFRAIIGAIVILADLVVFVMNHLPGANGTWELRELAFHAAFFGLGILLIDGKLAAQAVNTVAPWLPFTRKK